MVASAADSTKCCRRAAALLVIFGVAQPASALKSGPRVDLGRRSVLSSTASVAAAAALGTGAVNAPQATATIGADSNWPLWLALPVAPYSRRKTIRRELKPGQVWAFDQLIGIYYVHVPIRMTVVKMDAGGLFVFAPVAPTKECLALLQPLIDQYGPVKHIVLPSTAVEHKVLAGPFARAFPKADFFVLDQQYSFPIPLPNSFLGLPSWTKPLPRSSDTSNPFGSEFEHEVLTVKPGPGSYFQDVAVVHKPSKTVLLCDAMLAVTEEPPPILTSDPEYTRALLFHARDGATELVEDTPENRRKGWRRIADIGLGPLLALKGNYPLGWGGWQPFRWRDAEADESFARYSANGKPALLPIIQIILNRGVADGALKRWVAKVQSWSFDCVVPAHLDAPINIGPAQFAEPFEFANNGGNEMRFCDEDVALLREAEKGPLKFSVTPTTLGPLTGSKGCNLGGGGEPRVISKTINLKWTPK